MGLLLQPLLRACNILQQLSIRRLLFMSFISFSLALMLLFLAFPHVADLNNNNGDNRDSGPNHDYLGLFGIPSRTGESTAVSSLKDLHDTPSGAMRKVMKPQQQLSRLLPIENTTIRAAAFKAMIKMMEVRTPPLWHGDTVAVIGSNIQYVVKRLHSEYKRLTIIGGELNATALAELRQNQNGTFFHLKGVLAALEAQVPSGSVDSIFVWDLKSELFLAGLFGPLNEQFHRMLKNGGTKNRYVTLAFVMARKRSWMKNAPLFPRDAKLVLKHGMMAAPEFPVLLLQKSAREWARARGELVEQEPFLEKCRSTAEHLRDLDVLLRMTADVLEELGVTYWLDSGTLLGAYRFNAYNPMEDDHDIVVDYDEWIANVFKFREMMAKRIKSYGRIPSFHSFSDNHESYNTLIPQFYMLRKSDNVTTFKGNPQIDIILAKWNPEYHDYQIRAQWFYDQTRQGFPRNIIFSQAVQTKWKTAHGFLGSLPILGRQYPVPYDVEGYSAVWYAPSDYMNQMVMLQMKAKDEHCDRAMAFVYASKQPHLVQKMVARLKEVFPDSFNSQTCPLCRCVSSDCKVERTVVPLDPMPPTPPPSLLLGMFHVRR